MTPERVEFSLKWMLRLVGGFSLSAFLCVFLPYAWMDAVHNWLGLGHLPADPIVGYLARSLSAMYAFVSGFLCIASTDVRRYLPMVRFIGLATTILGVLLLGIGLIENLPLSWVIGEGPGSILYGLAILWLCNQLPPRAVSG